MELIYPLKKILFPLMVCYLSPNKEIQQNKINFLSCPNEIIGTIVDFLVPHDCSYRALKEYIKAYQSLCCTCKRLHNLLREEKRITHCAYLIDKIKTVNKMNHNQQTPLGKAIILKNVAMISRLLAEGADPNKPSWYKNGFIKPGYLLFEREENPFIASFYHPRIGRIYHPKETPKRKEIVALLEAYGAEFPTRIVQFANGW